MAKAVQIYIPATSSWVTLPGNTADLTVEAAEITDTIFGQNFSSNEAGLAGWTITSSAIYKGFAGYRATLRRVNGASTATTDEATTQIGGATSKAFQITDVTHRFLDRAITPTFTADGAAVAPAMVASVNFLTGSVTFAEAFAITDPSTVLFTTASYYNEAALLTVAGANSFTLTQTAAELETTTIEQAQALLDVNARDGYRTWEQGLKEASMEFEGIYRVGNANLSLLLARDPVVIEINPDGEGHSIARGYFRMTSQGQSGGVGELETESTSFNLNVPDQQNLAAPFAWDHTANNLNAAVREVLDAWLSGNAFYARYLPSGRVTAGNDGGAMGICIATEATLSGGLETMNEFATTLRGVGPLIDPEDGDPTTNTTLTSVLTATGLEIQ